MSEHRYVSTFVSVLFLLHKVKPN